MFFDSEKIVELDRPYIINEDGEDDFYFMKEFLYTKINDCYEWGDAIFLNEFEIDGTNYLKSEVADIDSRFTSVEMIYMIGEAAKEMWWGDFEEEDEEKLKSISETIKTLGEDAAKKMWPNYFEFEEKIIPITINKKEYNKDQNEWEWATISSKKYEMEVIYFADTKLFFKMHYIGEGSHEQGNPFVKEGDYTLINPLTLR